MKLLTAFVFVTSVFAASPAAKPEILWDTYGVPHIFAADREAMFWGHGYAQARNQADLLLVLYGESRGRGAEYWGPAHLPLDRWVQTNGVPERAKLWYAAQDPGFRRYLDAFAAGINAYGKEHPEAISPEARAVLPVTGVDVIGHTLRAVHYMYMASDARVAREVNAYRLSRKLARRVSPEEPEVSAGSNTWAIGPSHSASGNSMLLINPHLAWGNTFYRYMEVHLNGPGYDLYGSPQIGFPVAVNGFNRSAGWGRTVNTIDTVDFYDLSVSGDQYEYDGKLRPFERETRTLKIRQPDGSFASENLLVRRSIHGPVVYRQNGLTVAMRVAGLDRPKMLEQWFRMGEARTLTEFQAALRMMQVPMWNQNYADSQGHIMMFFSGLVPRRKSGDSAFWAGVVPGNTSQTMWTDYLSYDELPKSIDPPAGFNQNTNEPPWFMTQPLLDPAKFAAYLSPLTMGTTLFRTRRSLHMLTEVPKLSYTQLLADKVSTRVELADAALPDLLTAATASPDPSAKAAAKVLAAWDRQTEAGSRGAVLFQMFSERYFGRGAMDSKLRVHFDPGHPLQSASGLARPEVAVQALIAAGSDCRNLYGSLDVAWGDVNRFGSGNGDVAANGGPGRLGVFRTIEFGREAGGKNYATHGDTFVCAIEFGSRQQAQCALSYGNSSQAGSPHLEDQLPLMGQKKLHPVWREKAEIRQHLEKPLER